jgi:transcriptional repressor NrdR
MKCPFCGHLETQVVETRVSEEADFIRRRRRCGHCDKRFTTYERPEVSFPAVVKKDGRRVDFVPGKLRASFALAPSRSTRPSSASRKNCSTWVRARCPPTASARW